MRVLLLTGPLAVAIGMLSATASAPSFGADAPRGQSAVICMNPYSGTSWQIKIDYDRSTVDSNPAQINDATISWHGAADGWNYTLDRKSGDLTIVLASATGGNFLYDHCKLAN